MKTDRVAPLDWAQAGFFWESERRVIESVLESEILWVEGMTGTAGTRRDKAWQIRNRRAWLQFSRVGWNKSAVSLEEVGKNQCLWPWRPGCLYAALFGKAESTEEGIVGKETRIYILSLLIRSKILLIYKLSAKIPVQGFLIDGFPIFSTQWHCSLA